MKEVSETKKDYLQIYIQLINDMRRKNLDIDSMSDKELHYLQSVQNNATLQTSLSLNELNFILKCRDFGIFASVNSFANGLIRGIKSCFSNYQEHILKANDSFLMD